MSDTTIFKSLFLYKILKAEKTANTFIQGNPAILS